MARFLRQVSGAGAREVYRGSIMSLSVLRNTCKTGSVLALVGMSLVVAANAQTANSATPVTAPQLSRDTFSRGSGLWKWSLAIMTAANTADTITSLQCNRDPTRCGYERGFLYPGTKFSIGVKAAVAGGQVLAQWLIVRKRPRAAKWFVPGNAAQSGVEAWAVWHNARLE